MSDLLTQAWAVARKDLVLEFRTRTALVSAFVFTALVLTRPYPPSISPRPSCG